MRVFTLILACVLTFGCGCTTERSAQERSYTQDRGDVGQFILQHALAYGARPIKTNGLPALYGSRNPVPWMSETIDLRKEKNFFETRVTEFQSGGNLAW